MWYQQYPCVFAVYRWRLLHLALNRLGCPPPARECYSTSCRLKVAIWATAALRVSSLDRGPWEAGVVDGSTTALRLEQPSWRDPPAWWAGQRLQLARPRSPCRPCRGAWRHWLEASQTTRLWAPHPWWCCQRESSSRARERIAFCPLDVHLWGHWESASRYSP